MAPRPGNSWTEWRFVSAFPAGATVLDLGSGPGGRFLFTAPKEPLEWLDGMTGQPSQSLGAQTYERLLRDAGLTWVGKAQDGGERLLLRREAAVMCSICRRAGSLSASRIFKHTISANWLYSQALGEVKLAVPEGQAEDARKLLAADFSDAIEAEFGKDEYLCPS